VLQFVVLVHVEQESHLLLDLECVGVEHVGFLGLLSVVFFLQSLLFLKRDGTTLLVDEFVLSIQHVEPFELFRRLGLGQVNDCVRIHL